MGRLRGVIFGWEGVLVDTRDAYLQSVNNVLLRHGYPEISKETFDLLFVKGSVRMFISMGHPDEAEILAKERREEYDRIVGPLARKKDDSAGILRHIKASGYLVAIATNSHAVPLRGLVQKFGMVPFVNAVVTLEEALVAKPNPHMVSLACERLGLRPEECAIVGDRTIDMEAGRAAGVRCIGIAENEACANELFEAGADEVMGRLSDLPALLLK